MPRFAYEALALDGKMVSGTEQSETAGAAHLALINRGLQPLNISEKKSLKTPPKMASRCRCLPKSQARTSLTSNTAISSKITSKTSTPPL